MTFEAALDQIIRGGVPVLLLLALMAGWRGWWVYGPVHREVVRTLVAERDRLLKERDELLELALSATHQAGKATDKLVERGA